METPLKKAMFLGAVLSFCLPFPGSALNEENVDFAKENIDQKELTEEDLLPLLNESAKKLYLSLPQEAKTLALQVASARCQNTNKCSGLNSCKTEENSCAGKGSCKGTSKCAISNKNLAVKLAAKHWKKKQQGLLPEEHEETRSQSGDRNGSSDPSLPNHP